MNDRDIRINSARDDILNLCNQRALTVGEAESALYRAITALRNVVVPSVDDGGGYVREEDDFSFGDGEK